MSTSKNQLTCFNCQGSKQTVSVFFGYPVCDKCKRGLGLYKDETIKRHRDQYKGKEESFNQEVKKKLDDLKRTTIRKSIKLMHIQKKLLELD